MLYDLNENDICLDGRYSQGAHVAVDCNFCKLVCHLHKMRVRGWERIWALAAVHLRVGKRDRGLAKIPQSGLSCVGYGAHRLDLSRRQACWRNNHDALRTEEITSLLSALRKYTEWADRRNNPAASGE